MQPEEDEFGFSFCFHFFLFNLTFYKQLKTTTHHSYTGGEGAPKKAATQRGVGQGQLNLQGLLCGRAEMGKLRLWSLHEGFLACHPTSFHFLPPPRLFVLFDLLV